ncbi:MAG: family 2 glycosyl transferase, partial [Candidatus Melainabacteria bacterium HGW-Melainabacteria-1]
MLVSVIVPHYNRHDLLLRCLNALRQQHFGDFEIVLVDDGSTDPTLSELQPLFSVWPRLRRLVFSDNRGRAAARNAGLALARGELVIFLDADMDVGPDFVAEHWRFYVAQGAGWIGQGRIIGTQDPAIRPMPSLWTDASCARFATGNVSVAREILLRLGGFDEAFSGYGFEDLELGYRLMQAGWRSA